MENQKDNIRRSTRAELNLESIRKVFTMEIAGRAMKTTDQKLVRKKIRIDR